MSPNRLAGLALVALVAIATGFVLTGQLKTQLLTPSNQVARYQALVRSVQDLEGTNADSRRTIAALRAHISSLEAEAAQRSAATRALQDQVANLRAHAGLTGLHGPGVVVNLADGVPGPESGSEPLYQVGYQDVQDVVNLLFASGAEAIAVNGRRITPLTAYSGTEGQILIDQGPPLVSPLQITAVGDRNQMEAAIDDPANLPAIRARQIQFQLRLTVAGSPDVRLPAYDSSLQAPHVAPL